MAVAVAVATRAINDLSKDSQAYAAVRNAMTALLAAYTTSADCEQRRLQLIAERDYDFMCAVASVVGAVNKEVAAGWINEVLNKESESVAAPTGSGDAPNPSPTSNPSITSWNTVPEVLDLEEADWIEPPPCKRARPN